MNVGKKRNSQIPLISIDKDACVNCHACIIACPVKYCNDGSGDYVTVNHDMCIGCGNCIKKCTHNARKYIDQFDQFMEDISKGEKMVAIVAPSVASNFPDSYLNVNGFLKSLGIEAVFDVSFGAELTVKSYVEYIKSHPGKNVIAQPCPAIVMFIQLYMPELIPYLAPIDSPMLHTIKMIKRYYPQYQNHKIVAISPCIAKRREFKDAGHGDYNVGLVSLSDYFKNNDINLNEFPEEPYDTPDAERAVLFSTPGGLLQTIRRWIPDIDLRARKIEGVNTVYEYLESLPQAIADGSAPLLVDCLNCDFGCNYGPATPNKNSSLDTTEYQIEKRSKSLQQKYQTVNNNDIEEARKAIEELLQKYWEPGLYERHYVNLSVNNRVFVPEGDEMRQTLHEMHKYSDADMYNCNACGYGTCENMAIAVFHGLNRPENCHFYLAEKSRLNNLKVLENEKRLRTILYTAPNGFCLVDTNYKIILVNPALCSILGIEKEKLIGTTILQKQFSTCYTENKCSIEIRIKRSENNCTVCQFNSAPYHDDNNKLVGFFALVTDITPQRMLSANTAV